MNIIKATLKSLNNKYWCNNKKSRNGKIRSWLPSN